VPPTSTHIEQEGVFIRCFRLVSQGRLQEAALLDLLTDTPYPARNPAQNIADLQAQIAANEQGAQALLRCVEVYSPAVVQAYMQHVKDNAEESVRRVLAVLRLSEGDCGRFCYPMDDGNQVQVSITVDRAARSALIDFTGTSPQHAGNWNAPKAISIAAVLYVFRTLVDDPIPLNEGCLKPLTIHIPAGCLLDPKPPAAVVAGNVETSQVITDALYGALGIMAASQGTMNNVTFGNDRYQYYETICGGAGAGDGFHGASAVHTHMTNSRLTDPEVLEWRYPVLVECFSRRPGSGGAGRWHGGEGVIRRLKFREPMTAGLITGHRRVPPYGLNGGAAGQVGKNYLIRAEGQREELAAVATVTVNADDALIIETPGGGGFGEP
jgi:5-oxoprolinase (ATP-hydrolysing)